MAATAALAMLSQITAVAAEEQFFPLMITASVPTAPDRQLYSSSIKQLLDSC